MLKKYLTIAACSFIIFLGIAYTYETPAMQQLDEKAAQLLVDNEVMSFFHYFAETKFMIAVMILLIIALWLKGRHYKEMTFVFVAFLGGYLLNQGVKRYFERPRPEIADQFTSFSFPSGHAMLGCIYLFVLSFMLLQIFFNKSNKTLIYTITAMLVLFIGLSRVAESRHFITDVFAGWSLGFAWLLVCVAIYKGRRAG